MPIRETIFKNGFIYHIYNKTIDHKKLFKDEQICNKFLEISHYYRSTKASISYSLLKRTTTDELTTIMKSITYQKYFKVNIFAYCLMPTHFHFLMKQKTEYGIQKFIGDIVNSFTRFLNIKYERYGPLFVPRFKSKLIITEEQFIHVSRYIHLNPYSSGLITSKIDLINYPYSSFKDYVHNISNQILEKGPILKFFNNNPNKYMNFVLQNIEHQKTLQYIKHVNKFFKI